MEKIKNFKAQYILNGIIFAALFLVFSIYVGRAIPWHSGFLHNFWGFLTFIGFMGIVIHTLWECDARTPQEYEDLLKNRFLPVRFPGKTAALIVTVIIVHQVILGAIVAKGIYNTNLAYNKEYKKTEQQYKSLYDNVWKTAKLKLGYAQMNNEFGLQLTENIFSHRADGQNVAWKWLQENQPVPYGEFVKFYSELSAYIETQRASLYALEMKKQSIVYQQGMLLDTFPNNLYNVILNLKHLEYKPALLSDSTNRVFLIGEENP